MNKFKHIGIPLIIVFILGISASLSFVHYKNNQKSQLSSNEICSNNGGLAEKVEVDTTKYSSEVLPNIYACNDGIVRWK